MINLLLISAFLILLYATFWFIISIIKKRNDLADIAWGLGYILLSVYYLFTTEISQRALLIYALIFIWGLRLSMHIFLRNKGKQEDFRYQKWRNEWGKSFYLRSYLQVYLLQGFLLLMIASPATIVSAYSQPMLGLLDFIGVGIWLIGFYFEAVGDYQLMEFSNNPENKGKIIKHGLWKYSRHPNYFGEVVMWWGIFLVALNSPYGVYALVSPVTITLLILFVSGIPMLEKKYENNLEFKEYKKRTSAFFPLPQKKNS